MTASHCPAPGAPRPAVGVDDVGRWREAAQLRREHPGWVVVWLAPAGEFHAYRRLPGARRDTALTAPTSAGLADLIGRAEQAARPADRHAKDRT